MLRINTQAKIDEMPKITKNKPSKKLQALLVIDMSEQSQLGLTKFISNIGNQQLQDVCMSVLISNNNYN